MPGTYSSLSPGFNRATDNVRNLRDQRVDQARGGRVAEVVDVAAVRFADAAGAGDRIERLVGVALNLDVLAHLEEAASVTREHVRNVLAAVGRTVSHRVDPQVDAGVEQRATAGQRVGRQPI